MSLDSLLKEKEREGNIRAAIEGRLPFRPLYHWLVVKRDPDETMVGNLALPQRAQVKMNRGTVLAIGDGTQTEQGTKILVDNIKVGDVIQWADTGGRDIKIKGVEYTLVPAQNVVLVEYPDEADWSKLADQV